MTDAAEVPNESAEAQPAAPSRYEQAVALAKEQMEAGAENAVAMPDKEPEAPVEAPEETPEGPDLTDLESLLSSRLQERQAKQAEQAQATELQELRAMVQELKGQLTSQPREGMISAADLKSNPVAALQAAGIDLREHLRTSYQAVKSPDVAALQRELAEIKAKVGQPREDTQTVDPHEAVRQVMAEQQARAKAEADFHALATTKDGEKSMYPLLSRLPEAKRIERAMRVVQRFNEQEIPIDDREIAGIVERELSELHSMLAGGTPQTEAGNGQAASRKAATTTITSELTASGVPKQPRTPEERRAAAIALAKQLDL